MDVAPRRMPTAVPKVSCHDVMVKDADRLVHFPGLEHQKHIRGPSEADLPPKYDSRLRVESRGFWM